MLSLVLMRRGRSTPSRDERNHGIPVLFRRSAATTRSMASAARTREVPRFLLSRREAADALGMSLRHFQRHVQPYLRCVYSGQLRLYPLKDLERWVEEQACREGTAA